MPVVLVDLELQRGQLGQHVVGQPGVDEQPQPGARAAGASSSLVSSSRTRSADTISIEAAIARHRRAHLGRHVEAELGREPAARIIRSGSSPNDTSGAPGVRSRRGGEVGQPAVRVDELQSTAAAAPSR